MCQLLCDLRYIKVEHEVLVATHFLQQEHNTFPMTHLTHFWLTVPKDGAFGFWIQLTSFFLFIMIVEFQTG